MKLTWLDYDNRYADTVENWLDTDAKQYTGCDDGWNSFYEYRKNDDEMTLGENYWCKVICESDVPIAVIAISLYQNDFSVMEYIVSPEKRGKGYGSAALKELLDNGIAILGKDIAQAEAVIYSNNIASQKALETAGFVFDHAHPDGDAWYYRFERNNKMDNSIYLRPYEQSDESVVSANSEPLYYDKFKEFSNNTIRIATVNGNIVGWLHLTIPENSLYSGFLFIYVFPAYRRKGIGTLIYREAESLLNPVGCNFWSSYPESEVADRFVMSVGFDYTNTNCYMVYNGKEIPISSKGIRPCRSEDYPQAPDIWSREYANMHIRIGLPYKKHKLDDEERKEEFRQFIDDIKNSFVIEENSRIIGYGTLFDDNSGIGSVAIDRSFSGHSYGTRLAAFLTNECIRRGNSLPCLYCESGNNDAMHIYLKLGYVEVSRETVAIKNPKK